MMRSLRRSAGKRQYEPSIRDRILRAATHEEAQRIIRAAEGSAAFGASRSTVRKWRKAVEGKR